MPLPRASRTTPDAGTVLRHLTLIFAFTIHPAAAAGPLATLAAPPDAVRLDPNTDIPATLAAHPAGTTYVFAPGLYRIQPIDPKTDDIFLGEPGARLSGARIVHNPTLAHGHYLFPNPAAIQDKTRYGECQPEFPRYNRPQALFADNVPLSAVGDSADLSPGTRFFEDDTDRIVMADDPAGRTIELTVEPYAFGGKAQYVTIENLTIEKFASASQHFLWRRRVLRLARELNARIDFDVVHHISWNTISVPPAAVASRQTLRLGARGRRSNHPLAVVGRFRPRPPV